MLMFSRMSMKASFSWSLEANTAGQQWKNSCQFAEKLKSWTTCLRTGSNPSSRLQTIKSVFCRIWTPKTKNFLAYRIFFRKQSLCVLLKRWKSSKTCIYGRSINMKWHISETILVRIPKSNCFGMVQALHLLIWSTKEKLASTVGSQKQDIMVSPSTSPRMLLTVTMDTVTNFQVERDSSFWQKSCLVNIPTFLILKMR